jgi:hypothetical protein
VKGGGGGAGAEQVCQGVTRGLGAWRNDVGDAMASRHTSHVTIPFPSASMRPISCTTLSSNWTEAWSAAGVKDANSRRTSPVSITLLPSVSTWYDHAQLPMFRTRALGSDNGWGVAVHVPF